MWYGRSEYKLERQQTLRNMNVFLCRWLMPNIEKQKSTWHSDDKFKSKQRKISDSRNIVKGIREGNKIDIMEKIIIFGKYELKALIMSRAVARNSKQRF